jgi:L-lactate dehydrogenase complex protein LldG
MQESTTREKILKKIRAALIHHNPQPYPNIDWETDVYVQSNESLEETFAHAFTKIGGQFVFCESELEFLENVIHLATERGWKKFYCYEKHLTELMTDAAFPFTSDEKNFEEGIVGITSCEALVARLGSVVVSSKSESGRKLVVVPTTHIVLAYTSQLVLNMKEALMNIQAKYGEQFPSYIAALTGPSRTADIEKTLVTPAHGPRDIFVFLVDDKTSANSESNPN